MSPKGRGEVFFEGPAELGTGQFPSPRFGVAGAELCAGAAGSVPFAPAAFTPRASTPPSHFLYFTKGINLPFEMVSKSPGQLQVSGRGLHMTHFAVWLPSPVHKATGAEARLPDGSGLNSQPSSFYCYCFGGCIFLLFSKVAVN